MSDSRERKAPTGFIGAREGCLDTTWQTPPELVERVARYFGGEVPFDVCTAPNNPTGAKHFFTEADDALIRQWPRRWYCNPPYGKALTKGGWLEKIADEGSKCDQGLVLVSAARWEQHQMQKFLAAARAICYVRKRVDFIRADAGEPVSGNTYANMFVLFGRPGSVNLEAFIGAFDDVGLIVATYALNEPPKDGIKRSKMRKVKEQ